MHRVGNPAVVAVVLALALSCVRAIGTNAVLFLDFAHLQPALQLADGARNERTTSNGWLSFNSPAQFAELNFSRQLDGINACSIGGWFFVQRRGEQVLFGRGAPET